MNYNNSTMTSAQGLSTSSHRVLRNTYGLLALSLIPSVLGAYVGLHSGFVPFMLYHQMATFLGFLLVSFGLIAAITRFRNSAAGVLLLLAFTGIMGAYSSFSLSFVLKSPDGASLIALAFGSTALIFAVMSVAATFVKSTLQGFGKFLFVGLILMLVAMVANIFLQLPALYVSLLVISVAIFSGYLLYDTNRIIKGGETNYVMATLSLYIDLFNIFMSILDLLSIFDSR